MASLVGRINLFFRNIYLDYYEVFREIQKSAREKPLKATVYGGATVFVLNLFRTNEGLRSYNSDVISACNRIGSVPEGSRNPESYHFVQNIGDLNCHGLLKQIDLGFSTLIYRGDSNSDVALYRYNCPHLKPSVKEFFLDRLVDLNFLGHWIRLEMKMRDYDINENEYDEFIPNTQTIQQS